MDIKRGLSAVRGVRDALVRLVSWLAQVDGQEAWLVLVDPGITDASLTRELDEFKAALRPAVAKRLHLVVAREGEIENVPSGMGVKDWARVAQTIGAWSDEVRLPRPDRKSEVLRVLILQWLCGRGPVTSEWLGEAVGTSYRTVANALAQVGPALERLEDRRVRLRYFPMDAWARFIAMAHRARATMEFVDQSGQPRSLESLVGRLRSLRLEGVAIGGGLGAHHHYPQLNLVGAPRLDLCVHAPGKTAKVDFVNELDPGLRRSENPRELVRVAIHFLRRDDAMFSPGEDGYVWADPLECLADLHEAQLDGLATEFQRFIVEQGEMLSGRA